MSNKHLGSVGGRVCNLAPEKPIIKREKITVIDGMSTLRRVTQLQVHHLQIQTLELSILSLV